MLPLFFLALDGSGFFALVVVCAFCVGLLTACLAVPLPFDEGAAGLCEELFAAGSLALLSLVEEAAS